MADMLSRKCLLQPYTPAGGIINSCCQNSTCTQNPELQHEHKCIGCRFTSNSWNLLTFMCLTTRLIKVWCLLVSYIHSYNDIGGTG